MFCFREVGSGEVPASAIYGAREAHTHVDAHTGAFHDAIEGGFVGCEGEVCEESKGAKREGKDWWNDALEQPGCEEDGTIATES